MVVTRLISILLAMLLVPGPAAAFAMAKCGCASVGAASFSASAFGASGACAEGPRAWGDHCCHADDGPGQPGSDRPAPDDEPCDGCDCAMPCCSAGTPSVAMAQHAKRDAATRARVVAALAPDSNRGSPHLTRLKRPPRAVTAA